MKKLSEIKRKELLKNGIYKIINIQNNKFYIGSCSSKTYLYERLKHHQQDLLLNKHHNKYLQNAYNKYGIDNFYYEIIEICSPVDCINREQYWIDLLKPHYNLLKKAGSSLGRIVSKETGQKIRESNKLWWNNPENKKRMIIAFKNKIKRPKKVKIKKEYHGLCKKVKCLNTNEIFNSATEASRKLNISYSYTIELLNKYQKRKYAKWKIEYCK